jgi:hypothetical protein
MTIDRRKQAGSAEREALIASIYGAALAPLGYDRMVDMLDGLLFGGLDPLGQSNDAAAMVAVDRSSVSTHIEAARAVQQRIGRSRAVGDGLQDLVDAFPNPALVRLLCGFSANVSAMAGKSAPIARDDSSGVAVTRQIVLADGRRLAYVEQGAANGRPVLMIHNVPYGVELPAAALRQAREDNLRIIAPIRPGYGTSDMLAHTDTDSLLTQVAQDHKALLDALGLPKTLVISHAGGASFALRFASLYPASTMALIGVARARPSGVMRGCRRCRCSSASFSG